MLTLRLPTVLLTLFSNYYKQLNFLNSDKNLKDFDGKNIQNEVDFTLKFSFLRKLSKQKPQKLFHCTLFYHEFPHQSLYIIVMCYRFYKN